MPAEWMWKPWKPGATPVSAPVTGEVTATSANTVTAPITVNPPSGTLATAYRYGVPGVIVVSTYGGAGTDRTSPLW